MMDPFLEILQNNIGVAFQTNNPTKKTRFHNAKNLVAIDAPHEEMASIWEKSSQLGVYLDVPGS